MEKNYLKQIESACVLSPKMAKFLTRVTVGFHAEADFMNRCFPHSMLLRLPSISPKITVIDFAAQAFGKPCPFPLFVDDENVVAEDVCIIKNGRVKGYMTNRELAAKMQMPLTGNARIPSPGAEPEIYMRNTALLPWKDSFPSMLESVGNGFYLVDGYGAEGDEDGFYACHITEGYHIRNGIICEPIHNYVVWGDGIDFLTSISMVGDDFTWYKETFEDRPLAPQAFGAPTITARVSIEKY